MLEKIFLCSLIIGLFVSGFLYGQMYTNMRPGKTIIFKEECIIKKPSKQSDVYVTRL